MVGFVINSTLLLFCVEVITFAPVATVLLIVGAKEVTIIIIFNNSWWPPYSGGHILSCKKWETWSPWQQSLNFRCPYFINNSKILNYIYHLILLFFFVLFCFVLFFVCFVFFPDKCPKTWWQMKTKRWSYSQTQLDLANYIHIAYFG